MLLSLAALTVSPDGAQFILASERGKELIAKVNRDVAVRFSHAAEDDPAVHSQNPPSSAAAVHLEGGSAATVHLEDVHLSDAAAKQTQHRAEAIMAVRQLAWSNTRARLAAAFNGEGANASPLLNEETAHINEIERNLTETNAELQYRRSIANLTLAAYTAQVQAKNSSQQALDSKSKAERDADGARAAANSEIAAKDALRVEQAQLKHWRARHG
jgi:hypothetical protein